MQSHQYMPLNSWLGNADNLYLDARVLWLQINGMGGGLILMWLAIEQMMKTVTFQERIQRGESASNTMEDVLLDFTKWGKKIGHSFSANHNAISEFYPSILSKHEKAVLESVYDHFEARYVDKQHRSIEIKALHTLDKVYFRLRDLVSEDLPMSHIDMIDLHRKLPAFGLADYNKFAFIDNPHFHARKRYRT